MTTVATKLYDAQAVRETFAYFVAPGETTEIRVLGAEIYYEGYKGKTRLCKSLIGFFNDVDKLLAELRRIHSATGFYILLNRIPRDYIAKAKNTFDVTLTTATKDDQIKQLISLPIDADANDETNMSSTNEQHEQALQTVAQIETFLTQDCGWPQPVRADSGNGGHLRFAIDEPVENATLIERILVGLNKKFADGTVKIDTSIYNPARIFKLYGTLACKGYDSPEYGRPHRMSAILSKPDVLEAVSHEQLEYVANMLTPIVEADPKQETPPQAKSTQSAKGENQFATLAGLEAWLSGHGIGYKTPEKYNNGFKLPLENCMFNADHVGKDAAVFWYPDSLGHRCLHDSCKGNDWQTFRGHIEPEYLEKTAAWERGERTQRTSTSAERPHQSHQTEAARPEIFLGEQDRVTRDACIKALEIANSVNPTLFVQINSLVSIGKETDGRGFTRQVRVHELKNLLTDAADFYRMKKVAGTDDEYVPVATSVPQSIVEEILALAPHQWPFKVLNAIVETPVLRPDGTILNKAGYDDATRLYYVPGANMDKCFVPLNPTKEDVQRASALLRKGIHQFPYESQADFANTFATPFTPIIRHCIPSDVQMGLVDATKQGTGKGKLTNYFSILATGERAVPIGLPNRDEELEKRIDAKLLKGSTMFVIDNITRKLDSATLELILTTSHKEVRPLGTSTNLKVLNSATWIATGNNLQLGGDLARRCYRIRLVSPVSNPDERDDFEIKDLEEWTFNNRPQLVAALLTIARAWIVAGKPKPKNVPNIGNFSKWAKAIGGILEYVGIEGFQGNRAELKAESNVEEGECEAFLLAWQQCFGSNLVLSKTVATTIKDTLTEVACSDAGSPKQLHAKILAETLPTELKEALQDKPTSFDRKLSKWLEKRVKTPYGEHNIRIEFTKDKHTRINSWQVLRVVACSSGVSNDFENNSLKSDDTKDIHDMAMDAQTTRNYTQARTDAHVNTSSSVSTSHVIDNSAVGDAAGSPTQLHASREALHFIETFLSKPGHTLRIREDDFIVIGVPESTSDADYMLIVEQVNLYADAIKAYLARRVA